ncbi:hypothetical protein C5167_026309 [Papaver somniferum]|nr:hypothetical protein C5167_026309 [Papaver somniferum]
MVKFQLKKVLCMGVDVGDLGMDDKQIFQNDHLSVNFLVSLLKINWQNPTSKPPISELGPDALLEPMTTYEFFQLLRKKKIAIEPLLLYQNIICITSKGNLEAQNKTLDTTTQKSFSGKEHILNMRSAENFKWDFARLLRM